MPTGPAELLVAPLDSVRVVGHAYTVSLAMLAPLLSAAVAAVLLRHRNAATRALVWRAATIGLLAVYLGQLAPAAWRLWVLPGPVAEPLVALGRVVVASETGIGGGTVGTGAAHDARAAVRALAAIYVAGVVLVLLPLVRGWRGAARIAHRSARARDTRLLAAAQWAAAATGLRQVPAILMSPSTTTPFVTGIRRPSVVLPLACRRMSEERLRAVLVHELAHVAAHDLLFGALARVACALLWFHPGSWLVAARLRREVEHACDDRAIEAGTRPSEYAALLVEVADMGARPRVPSLAPALAGAGGLRERLRATVATTADRGPATRWAVALAASALLIVGGPAMLVELAPTRQVLQELMHDSRWESRAFAVLGLAPRPDSIAVARAAARMDREPMVRAWAAYAVSQQMPAAREAAAALHILD